MWYIILAYIFAITLLIGLILFLLFHFGLINSYHPQKKAKDNQIRVACVGDSITYGLMVRNWQKNNYPAILGRLLGENYCVNNFGYTNRTAIKSGDYPLVNEKIYKQSLDFKPHIVVLLLGANDSKKNNWDKDQFVNDYREIIDSFRALACPPKIYILLPTPLFEVRGKVLYNLRKTVVYEEIIPATKRIAEAEGIDYVDTYEIFKDKRELFVDGVHPNAKGSKLLAKSVFEALTFWVTSNLN